MQTLICPQGSGELVPALFGIGGTILGALVAWIASLQVAKWSFDAQEKARCKQERAHLEGKLEGLKILAKIASQPSHYNRLAYAVREFFFSTPKLFDDVQNADLFGNYLAELNDPPATPPSDQYWKEPAFCQDFKRGVLALRLNF